ncbi:MAG: hypothetical protein ABL996_04775 [Micropepsaceae bacterium]
MTITHHDSHTHPHESSHAMINPTVLALSLGLFALFSYFLCIVLALAFPPMTASMKILYLAIFPGFVWLTAQSIVWGAVFLAVASFYVGCGFALTYNFVCRIVHT